MALTQCRIQPQKTHERLSTLLTWLAHREAFTYPSNDRIITTIGVVVQREEDLGGDVEPVCQTVEVRYISRVWLLKTVTGAVSEHWNTKFCVPCGVGLYPDSTLLTSHSKFNEPFENLVKNSRNWRRPFQLRQNRSFASDRPGSDVFQGNQLCCVGHEEYKVGHVS